MTIRKLDTGGYEIRGDFEDPRTGKRRQVRRRFKTLREAREFERELMTGEATGKRGVPTFAEYAQGWATQRAQRRNLTPNTYRTYRWAIDEVSETLGARRINTIRQSNIEDAIADVACRLSANSTRQVFAIINRAFKAAVREGLLTTNPAQYVENIPSTKKRVRTPNADALADMLRAAEGDLYVYAFLLGLASTGARKGEMFGLMWDCVDLDRCLITIRRQRARLGHKKYQADYPQDMGTPVPGLPQVWRLRDETKTRQVRQLRVPRNVVELLRELRVRQRENQLRLGSDYIASNYVFVRPDGRPLVERDVVSYLGGYTFHSLRHAHATILLDEGVPLLSVSRRLGHSVLATTSDIYAELLKKQDDTASDVFAAAVDTKMTHVTHTDRA